MRQKFTIAAVLLFFTINAFAQTSISPGEVYGTWGESGSPYLIQGDIVIPNDSTLTIEQGVTVEFQGYFTLDVQGRLLAVGSASQNISFTVNDTTGFYNPDDTLGGWNGIQFIDTPPENDTSKIIFCSLQYGKAVDTIQPGNLGGAVYVNNCSKIIISNCQISYNSAGGSDSPSGGGICLFSADIVITGNVLSHNTSLAGGAILVYDSDPVFTGNTIEYNTSGQAGGGIWIGGESNPVFNNDIISNNTAAGSGGGIICWQTTNTVLNAVNVSNNTAHDGGALWASECELHINGCSITDNSSGWIGGGINAYSCTVDINNTNFERDTAYIFGGAMGIYYSELNITNSNLTDNAARILGGGIHSDGTNIALNNVTFERDTTDDSGGAIFTWKCEMTINDCDFVDNSSISGGAICFDSCSVFINKSLFNENTSLWGGGIFGNRGELTLNNTSFEGNVSDHGGAVNVNNSDLQMDSCMFYQNISQIEGGGLVYNADTSAFISAYHLIIDNSVFEENSSISRCGAILATSADSELPLIGIIINRSEFLNNQAQRIGAVRISNAHDFIVSDSRFIGNNVEQFTAACTFAGLSKGSVYNCVFAHNSTGGGTSGGAGVSNFADVSFTNCTFVNNKSGSGGGIQIRTGSIVTAINNIFWGNYPDQISLNAVNDSSECILYSYNNDIQYGIDSVHISDSVSVINWGTGNIDSDPLFADTLNNDFHIESESSCISAGADSIEIAGLWYYCPAADIEGNPRPDPAGSMPDMGAYESQYPVGIKNDISAFPTEFALYQNYPNPFNPSTKIKYQIPRTSYVKLIIYNVLGREVETLVDGVSPSGFYELEYNASHLSSGVYFYRLKAGEYIGMKKMVLIK